MLVVQPKYTHNRSISLELLRMQFNSRNACVCATNMHTVYVCNKFSGRSGYLKWLDTHKTHTKNCSNIKTGERTSEWVLCTLFSKCIQITVYVYFSKSIELCIWCACISMVSLFLYLYFCVPLSLCLSISVSL